MMALADRVNDKPRNKTGGIPCSVGVAIESLAGQPDEIAALNAILEDRRRTEADVFQIFLEEGIHVSRTGISNHRRHGCRCFA